MIKKYTIRDIAQLAGVSKGTVDRVLHNRGKVSEDALIKVNKILDEINFIPNPIAKNLKNNKVYRICVLLPNPEKDAYWSPCVVSINDVISEFRAFGIKIETYFFDATDISSFLEANLEIQNSAPDAVLLAPIFLKEASIAIENYTKAGITVSNFNNQIDSENIKNFIGQDLYQSGRVAAKLLHAILTDGDIAIIHIDEKYKNAIHMQEKEKGFKSYFNDLNGFQNKILTYKLNNPKFEEKLRSILNEQPNLKGIFVSTSKGYQVAQIIKEQSYPKIALVCYDLLNENVDFLKNGVIDFLIHQNVGQQTYLALKYLVEYFLLGKEIPKKILIPIDIINSENVTPFIKD